MHKIPADLYKALVTDLVARSAWEDITPLARNEWICWIVSTKKSETRKSHIERTTAELKKGKRRPCCWAGCPHR
ncbi:MAG: YdeI/OmpD-associated family protein [Patescibacteria group bacterium]